MEYVSEASERYTGVAAETLMLPGTRLDALIHADDVQDVVDSIDSAAESLQSDSIGLRCQRVRSLALPQRQHP